MALDAVIAEVRQTRDEVAKRFDYDLRAIIEDAKVRQLAGGRKVVTLPPRPARKMAKLLQQTEPALRQSEV